MKLYNRNAAQQKVETFDVLSTLDESGTAEVEFKVPVPDSRLRVKVSVLFIPAAGVTLADGSLDATLWLREAEVDLSGVSGALIPATNIEGTEAGPTAIPAAVGLQGYSRELVTAADFILGTLDITADGGTSAGGSWVLQTRYQPQAVRFTDEEWQDIVARCNPSVYAGPFNT